VLAIANVISAATNIPTDRVVMKLQNVRDASMGDFETWQRVSMFMGWNKWQLGVGEQGPGEQRIEEIETRLKKEKKEVKEKEKVKEEKPEDIALENQFEKDQKKERKQGKKDVTCIAVSGSGNRCQVKTIGKDKYCTIHQKVDQRKDGKKKQCSAYKSDKTRCKMQTSNKSGYCYYHD
jgi:hypothetical protein